MSEKTSLPYDHVEKVCRAEIYQALQVAHSNYCFTSTQENSKRFKLMFSYCPITYSYVQADAKVKYNLQFGIAPYCKEQLRDYVKRRPFTFKFDESSNKLFDKQYN